MPTKPSTKSEIYTYISERATLKKKEVGAVFDALADMISRDLKRGVGVFNVPGLMKIKAVHKPAVPERRGINPFTKEETTFKAKPARNVVKVQPLKGLKDMV
jgi:nucleoid DNA-binding protein